MKYYEFINLKWCNSKAYILGLIFTRIDIGTCTTDNKNYLIGQVAHNSKMASEKQVIGHVMNLLELLITDGIGTDGIALYNDDIKVIKDDLNTGRKSGKKGFVVAIELQELNNDNLAQTRKEINNDMINLVANIPKQYLEFLVAGTIDGRSSFDTTMGFISIDIDRDPVKQDLIRSILSKINFEVNINTRERNHPKADQLRYRPSDLKRIVNFIPLMSEIRRGLFKVNLRKRG